MYNILCMKILEGHENSLFRMTPTPTPLRAMIQHAKKWSKLK
jgi:hypothetical protein